jgi:hypothetical protein
MAGAKEIDSGQAIGLYTQAAFGTNQPLRPELRCGRQVYPSLYQWTRLSLLIHDFTMDESRQLRCDWYDECYLF